MFVCCFNSDRTWVACFFIVRKMKKTQRSIKIIENTLGRFLIPRLMLSKLKRNQLSVLWGSQTRSTPRSTSCDFIVKLKLTESCKSENICLSTLVLQTSEGVFWDICMTTMFLWAKLPLICPLCSLRLFLCLPRTFPHTVTNSNS